MVSDMLENVRRYPHDDPDCCPYCESSNIEGDFVEIDGLMAVQTVRCRHCDRTWTDVYRLVGYVGDDDA